MFKLKKFSAACGLAVAALAGAPAAQAQISGDVIRIGFITDLSGLYADIDGPAGAEAVRMAVADLGGSVAGKKVEVLVADHQNKADVAAAKAREWFDTQGLDMLIGGTNSGTNLAMAKVALEKKRRLQVRASGLMFQYQLSVMYMPCVAGRPSEWMSLMNTSSPASFIVLVTPNSLAALIELMVSPPAFARPRICALLDCACSRNDEKSLVDSGCLTEPTIVPPAALTTVEVSFCSCAPKA